MNDKASRERMKKFKHRNGPWPTFEVDASVPAQQGIDIEAEIMAILAQQITRNIDREIIKTMPRSKPENPLELILTGLDDCALSHDVYDGDHCSVYVRDEVKEWIEYNIPQTICTPGHWEAKILFDSPQSYTMFKMFWE